MTREHLEQAPYSCIGHCDIKLLAANLMGSDRSDIPQTCPLCFASVCTHRVVAPQSASVSLLSVCRLASCHIQCFVPQMVFSSDRVNILSSDGEIKRMESGMSSVSTYLHCDDRPTLVVFEHYLSSACRSSFRKC